MSALYFKKNTSVKIQRELPSRPNMCKLSIYSNALNYFGYEKRFGYKLSPDILLQVISKEREKKGFRRLDLVKDIVPSKDLNAFARKTGLVKVKCYFGKDFINKNKWKELLKNKKCLIAPYHQMIYEDEKFMTSKIVKDISKGKKFSYKKFIELVEALLTHYGPFDHGHIDLVMDIKEIKGKDYIVLANLNSTTSDYPIRIPWNLFSNYMIWYWYGNHTLEKISILPSKKEMSKLIRGGNFKRKEFEFVYGMVEVFCSTK